MSRFLYEKSVSERGHLIIPFVFGTADSTDIYSYILLSALGHKGKFHQVKNPARVYSGHLDEILKIAKEHLETFSDVVTDRDYFKLRYTYHEQLIIVYEEAGKFFYDHYPATQLTNLAAPKIFNSEFECISWIRAGLERSHTSS
ncbi:MAG: hypothetical protein ACM37W_25835 [Actinomycetota bacterium]